MKLTNSGGILTSLASCGVRRTGPHPFTRPHSSTLISSGKTRRATRSSTNFGESRSKPVSISINGNGHPEKFIPMDRGMTGSHTACTKERFLTCLDHSTARHATLPAEMQLPEGVPAWTWLPLLPQHAEVFGWEAFFDNPKRSGGQPVGDS